jgi:magnesium transporter
MALGQDEHMVVDLLVPEISEMLAARRLPEAREALAELLDPEVADVILALPAEQRAVALRALPSERAADVFPLLEYDEQEELVAALSDKHLAGIFDEMDPDDRVEFLEDAPDDLVQQLLALMHPDEREETARLLEYPEESVGRLVTTDYMTLKPEWSAREALEMIREHGHDAETLHTLYVVDSEGKLLDHIRLRDLVLARPTERCEVLRRGQTVSLKATDDREEAVHMMERYDLPVLPVVDDDSHMVGIVTFDDVADVAEEEVTEDIHKLGGMAALDEPYLAASLPQLIRKRVVWLTILFGGEILTIAAISQFETQLATVVALAFFMPLIIASGGNSGNQAATLIIRAMAVGDVELGDWWRVVRRELVSGLSMGLWLGCMGAMTVGLFSVAGWIDFQGHAGRLALAIPVSLLAVVTCGCTLGATLPLLFRVAGLDPATGSNPMVATLMDVTGLMIYFSTAMAILNI